MIVHTWGLIDYEAGRTKMHALHKQAQKDGKNHLILCAHTPVFTLGSDQKVATDIPVISSDRAGSITCHSPGQNIAYFCFQIKEPALFYRRVIRSYEKLLQSIGSHAHYDKKAPGFYLQNRKIASLGFRYSQGVSLHGVALNRDVDLDFHNQIPPCNLKGIRAGSLYEEGIKLTQEALNEHIIHHISEAFHDPV